MRFCHQNVYLVCMHKYFQAIAQWYQGRTLRPHTTALSIWDICIKDRQILPSVNQNRSKKSRPKHFIFYTCRNRGYLFYYELSALVNAAFQTGNWSKNKLYLSRLKHDRKNILMVLFKLLSLLSSRFYHHLILHNKNFMKSWRKNMEWFFICQTLDTLGEDKIVSL